MKYIIPIFVGAIIGYITNWFAIKMLFRPHYEKRIFGIRIPFTPGLIPKEMDRIARSVGNTVGEYLLSSEIIIDSISNKDNNEKFQKWIVGNINKLKENGKSIKEISGISEEEFQEYQILIENNLVNYVNSKMGIENGENSIGELIPENMIVNLKNYIEDHNEDIVNGIRKGFRTASIEIKIKNMIEEIVSKNAGKLITRFVPVEAISSKIYNIIESYLYNPRINEDINFFIITSLDKILEKEISSGKLNENIYSIIHNNLEKFVNMPISNILGNMKKETIHKIADLSKATFEWFTKNKLPDIVELFNVAKIIEEEILAFDVAFAEELILEIASKELKAITWLGALLGGIMGILMPLLSAINI
ncbi:MAG: DUF445 family protein [Tissierellia bacterium]|nr:DUF445 family protein [Tissierellia bacterium]